MLKAKNWSSYQSYKDRNPPWIRLHKRLIDDINFQRMSADARATLPMLWLLISEDEEPVTGLLRIGYEEISFRLRQPEKLIKSVICEIIKAGFFEEIKETKTDSYGTVTEPLQNCHSETETETETETYSKETEERQKVHTAFEKFNELAKRIGLPVAQKITKARKAKMALRLKDVGGLEGWDTVLQKIEKSDFLRGENKSGWVADVDFVLQESSIVKIMEGKYEANKQSKKKNVTEQLEDILQNGW
jgi:hypothetical protein